MNLLLDDINVVVNKKIRIKFNTNFRTCILFELLMLDNKIENAQKIPLILNLFYSNIEQIADIEKAIDDILWFYRCGKEEKASENNNKNERKNKQIYSYEFDDELIYSAFKDQYDVDLQDIKYLHWWKFKAMFEGLKDDNQIVKIMGYRAMDISKIKDKDEKKHYKRLQQLYALPDMRTVEQKEADFGRAFW